MTLLIIAALVWLGIHFGISGTRLRDATVTRIGNQPFRGLFSLLTILSIVFLVWAWRSSTTCHSAAICFRRRAASSRSCPR